MFQKSNLKKMNELKKVVALLKQRSEMLMPGIASQLNELKRKLEQKNEQDDN